MQIPPGGCRGHPPFFFVSPTLSECTPAPPWACSGVAEVVLCALEVPTHLGHLGDPGWGQCFGARQCPLHLVGLPQCHLLWIQNPRHSIHPSLGQLPPGSSAPPLPWPAEGPGVGGGWEDTGCWRLADNTGPWKPLWDHLQMGWFGWKERTTPLCLEE